MSARITNWPKKLQWDTVSRVVRPVQLIAEADVNRASIKEVVLPEILA